MLSISSYYSWSKDIAGAFCIPLFYMAFFVYRSDADRLHSRLESLWVRVQDASVVAAIRQGTILADAAKIALGLLDRTFGETRFSFKSLSAFALAFLLGILGLHLDVRGYTLSSPVLVEWYLPVTFIVAFFLNELTLKVNRGLLVTLSQSSRVGRFVPILWNLILALGLTSLAHYYSFRTGNGSAARAYRLYYDLYWWLARRAVRFPGFLGMSIVAVAMFLPAAMIITSLISLGVAFAVCLVLLHSLMWPLMSRPLFAICDWELLKNKQRQLALGIALFLYATHDILLQLGWHPPVH